MSTWRTNIPNIKRMERREASRYVLGLAFAVEALAKTYAPVLTGYLRNSIQTEQTGELSAVVYVGAFYGLYVELGTRYKAARPFLLPALEQIAASAGGQTQRWF